MQESEGSDSCPSEDNINPEDMALLLPEKLKSKNNQFHVNIIKGKKSKKRDKRFIDYNWKSKKKGVVRKYLEVQAMRLN